MVDVDKIDATNAEERAKVKKLKGAIRQAEDRLRQAAGPYAYIADMAEAMMPMFASGVQSS